METQNKISIEKIEKKIPSLKYSQALELIYEKIDYHKGALFVSNYEVPDRYSRWDIGFINPALEIVSRKREFFISSLNKNGDLLLKLIKPILENHPHVSHFYSDPFSLNGVVKPMPAFFSEEERSKQPSVFSVIRSISKIFKSEESYFGLYGAFGYDLVFQFETIVQKHERPDDIVDCHLFLPLELIVVDRRKEQAFEIFYKISTPEWSTEPGCVTDQKFELEHGIVDGELHCDHNPGEFQNKVKEIREGCRRGDFFEVVLSQSFSMGFNGSPKELFHRICNRNPSPYTFFINMGDEQLLGASPEMFVRVNGTRVEMSPISGTVPVGEDEMETADRIKFLISSPKEESELTMCTDVDRNDLSRICVPGSVKVIGRRLIERYSRLIHTVDHIEGTLTERFDAIDALLCHMWACTVTGSPKPIAMQTIEDFENSPRRWYSGCIGFLSFNGNLNTGMTLRTVHLKNGTASVRAGATLLFDSDPESEEIETRIKASAFLEATLENVKPQKIEKICRGSAGKGKKVLFVDNQDSFVHTLANYVRQTEAEVITLRAGFPIEKIDEINPDLVFISPGPKKPVDLGVPQLVGKVVKRNIPIFGVCLGHQGIAEYFGGTLKTLSYPFHGKPATIKHNEEHIFKNIPNPFVAARYHSLYVDRESLPDCFEITAETSDGLIMGLKHRELPIFSVQFHPESILTLKHHLGNKIIENLMLLI